MAHSISKFDCGIYKIVSPSGNFYIGSSKQIPKRWADHRRHLEKGTHTNSILQNAVNKYGLDALSFEKILICQPSELLFYEQLLLDSYKPKYNICDKAGSGPSRKGIPFSEEHKKNLSISSKGNKSRTGKPHTEETKRKQSQARLGIKYSEETIQKMRESGRTKIFTEEHRKNISLARTGRKNSEETKKKMSESAKLRWARQKSND